MADSLRMTCAGCQSSVKLRPEHFGKNVSCPKCHATISVPTVTPNPKAAASKPPTNSPTSLTDHAVTISQQTSHAISPTTLEWGRIALIAGTVLFLVLGAAKFLQAESPNYTSFVPGGVFAGCFVVFELLRYFLDVLHLYTLSTAVAFTAFFSSVVILLFAINQTDAGRQSGLFGFAGSLLGFATGIPFGQLLPQLVHHERKQDTNN